MATGKMFLEPSVHVFLKVYEKHGKGEKRKKRGVIRIHRFCSQRVDFHCLKKGVAVLLYDFAFDEKKKKKYNECA